MGDAIEALRELMAARDAVEDGIVSFDLHHAAVARLEAAGKAARDVLAGVAAGPQATPDQTALWEGDLDDLVSQLDYGSVGPVLEAIRSRCPGLRVRVVASEGPQATPDQDDTDDFLDEAVTVESNDRWCAAPGQSYLLERMLDCLPGTRVRVVAVPTDPKDPTCPSP